jgi:hypothetical protein
MQRYDKVSEECEACCGIFFGLQVFYGCSGSR